VRVKHVHMQIILPSRFAYSTTVTIPSTEDLSRIWPGVILQSCCNLQGGTPWVETPQEQETTTSQS
jgi:hypothetical protein